MHGRDRIYRGVQPRSRFMALSFSVLHCSINVNHSTRQTVRADRHKNNVGANQPFIGDSFLRLQLSLVNAENFDASNIAT